MVVFALSVLFFAGCVSQDGKTNDAADEKTDEGGFRTVVDMRGKEVLVPMEISRVITIDDGFAASVMTSIGVGDKVAGLGSGNLKFIDEYEYEDVSGENYSYVRGMNPVTLVNPGYTDLPAVAEYGEAVNYETIASINPDVVIVRLGFCSMNLDEYGTQEEIDQKLEKIESLGIPLVVLYGPPYYGSPDVSKISAEIMTIGRLFGKEPEAERLSLYLENVTESIRQRTIGVSEEEKKSVLLFGLSPNARGTGGAGDILGTDTMESYFVENVSNARNAYGEKGGWKIAGAEQVLKIDPDVMVLPTDWGYHPASELYTAPYYRNLAELEAVKNRQVYALPYTPYNCAKRIEYPIEEMIIAKAAYPGRFSDVKVGEWVLDFYKNVYGVDEDTAKEMRSVQWLNWTVESGW